MTRLAAVALVIAVALGAAWWWALSNEVAGPIAQNGHHDFFAFYAAATLVRAGRAVDLYNAAVLTTLERRIWPEPTGYAGYMPFLNPPSAAVMLSPLGSVGYGAARLIWLGISAAIAMVCALVLTAGRAWRVRALAIVPALASFPAYQALVEGQWSFLLLLGGLGALIAARRRHPWLAGAALAALWLKPPLLFLVLVWLVLTHRWRVTAGAVATVAAVTLVSLPWTGIAANVAYANYLGAVSLAHAAGGGAAGSTTWEGAFANMEGLIGLAATLMGQSRPLAVDALTAVMAAALIAYFVWATHASWLQRPLPLTVALSALSLGLLLDPHLYAQDCVLLLVLAYVTLTRMVSAGVEGGLGWGGLRPATAESALLIATALLMDLSAIDTYTIQGYPIVPLHLFTLVLIAAVVLLGRAARRI